ncbi:MAG: BrnT family toxin [Chamaesiphon sp.]|nr:BrnT family toxin [Chamaesiphon sp.]
MPNFEYDERKSQSNLTKHGIDFVASQQLWHDPNLIEIPARTQDEQRFLVVAKIDDKHWSGVITYRDPNIRIISIRRSRIEEITLYESSGI